MAVTLGELRKAAIDALRSARIKSDSSVYAGAVTATPALDCDCIISHFLQVTRAGILAHPEMEVCGDAAECILDKIRLRCTGLPVAYIIGKKEFFGREFFVSPSVLIPKGDTELLVERALELLLTLGKQREKIRLVDACTGSGCVAISLWKELAATGKSQSADFFATDISSAALDVAKKNGIHHRVAVEFILADLLQDLRLVDLDLVVSNPPYVPHAVAKSLLEDGRSEPLLALDGDCGGSTDGTGIIARLVPQGFAALNSGGFILLETGEYNAEIAADIMRQCGFVDIGIHHDLAGMPRVVEGRKA